MTELEKMAGLLSTVDNNYQEKQAGLRSTLSAFEKFLTKSKGTASKLKNMTPGEIVNKVKSGVANPVAENATATAATAATAAEASTIAGAAAPSVEKANILKNLWNSTKNMGVNTKNTITNTKEYMGARKLNKEVSGGVIGDITAAKELHQGAKANLSGSLKEVGKGLVIPAAGATVVGGGGYAGYKAYKNKQEKTAGVSDYFKGLVDATKGLEKNTKGLLDKSVIKNLASKVGLAPNKKEYAQAIGKGLILPGAGVVTAGGLGYGSAKLVKKNQEKTAGVGDMAKSLWRSTKNMSDNKKRLAHYIREYMADRKVMKQMKFGDSKAKEQAAFYLRNSGNNLLASAKEFGKGLVIPAAGATVVGYAGGAGYKAYKNKQEKTAAEVGATVGGALAPVLPLGSVASIVGAGRDHRSSALLGTILGSTAGFVASGALPTMKFRLPLAVGMVSAGGAIGGNLGYKHRQKVLIDRLGGEEAYRKAYPEHPIAKKLKNKQEKTASIGSVAKDLWANTKNLNKSIDGIKREAKIFTQASVLAKDAKRINDVDTLSEVNKILSDVHRRAKKDIIAIGKGLVIPAAGATVVGGGGYAGYKAYKNEQEKTQEMA